MGAQQILKRIPKIKFPDRRLPTSGGKAQSIPVPKGVSSGGSASIQPKRVPLSKEEVEVITMGGR